MDISERAVLQEIGDKVASDDRREHLISVIEALKLAEYGAKFFQESDPGGAIGLHERILRELEHIPGVEVLSALVRTCLISEYAKVGLYDDAIAKGRVALPILASDPRLAYAYAGCLHDMGAALINNGQVSEGIKFMEKAKLIYDNLPDRSRGEICRDNLKRLRAAFGHG